MSWQKIRQQVLQRDEYTCQTCFKKLANLEVHHIIPRRKKGTDSFNNLITVCEICHFLIELEPMSNIKRKSIIVDKYTYSELVKLGSGYKESMDDIVTKCIRSYKKEYKIK